MKVTDLWQRSVVTCAEDASIRAVAAVMRSRNVGCVVVLDVHSRMAGIVTDRDIALRSESPDASVATVMSRDVVYVYERDDIFDAATRMATSGFRRMPVLDASGIVRHMITLDDLFVVFARQMDKLARAVGNEAAAPAA